MLLLPKREHERMNLMNFEWECMAWRLEQMCATYMVGQKGVFNREARG